MTRIVVESDFRKDEFRDAIASDYEFSGDGSLVRKDRWQMAINTIRNLVGIDGRKYEIADVIAAVRKLVDVAVITDDVWVNANEYLPNNSGMIMNIKLTSGTILLDATYNGIVLGWEHMGSHYTSAVSAWEDKS